MTFHRNTRNSTHFSSTAFATPHASDNVEGSAEIISQNSKEANQSNANNTVDAGEDSSYSDWGFFSDEDDDSHLFPPQLNSQDSGGVLIVSGDEESTVEGSRRDGVCQGRIVSLDHLYNTAANLSFPRADDSFSTHINSIDISEIRKSQSEESYEENKEDEVNGWNRRKQLFLLVLTSILMAVVSASLAWNNHSWRSNTLILEQELVQLQVKLQEQQAENLLKTTKHEEDYANNNSDGENSEYNSEEQKILLVDNCWIRAEASFTFGGCTEETKGCAKEASRYLWDSISSVGKTLKERMSYGGDEEWRNLKEGEHGTSGYCLGTGGVCFSSRGLPLLKSGFSIENISEVSYSIASATVAASDAMMHTISGASSLVEHYVSYVVDNTSEAIRGGTILDFLD